MPVALAATSPASNLHPDARTDTNRRGDPGTCGYSATHRDSQTSDYAHTCTNDDLNSVANVNGSSKSARTLTGIPDQGANLAAHSYCD